MNEYEAKTIPLQDYTPHGYLDNPWHSLIYNKSGIIRSVPPLGFGFWCRECSFGYGLGYGDTVNYLSFLHPSVKVGDVCFADSKDFDQNGVKLVSRYHTSRIMTYDWQYNGIAFCFKYILKDENSLVCFVSAKNNSGRKQNAKMNFTNIYGYNQHGWWGSDGVTGCYSTKDDAYICKIFAYGDVFMMGADKCSSSHNISLDRDDWLNCSYGFGKHDVEQADIHLPGALYATLVYDIDLETEASEQFIVTLARGVNSNEVKNTWMSSMEQANETLQKRLNEDEHFYKNMVSLTGNWPELWKHGWIYDFETVRMTVRPPLGIFKHHWDGMQIFSPRSVLGEAMLDGMCLSYADSDLAKDMILGTFADAPMDNIPCTREDGSMNMIGADGSECGTSPVWGFPFLMIRAIYTREGDKEWLKKIYPYMARFLEWWLENRTDESGFFYCNNSWESGQDGSSRFLTKDNDCAAAAEYVRTVDVEAVMADAMRTMADLADDAGYPQEKEKWRKRAQSRIISTQSMFFDGEFRDMDSRTNEPIIIKNYFDIMMLVPLSVGIATKEQMDEMKHKFSYFKENPLHWLAWPSFVFPYAEAGWNAGLREMMSEAVCTIADRLYGRTAARTAKQMENDKNMMPKEYNIRIPGVASESWPITEDNYIGGEGYGWGATMPTLVIRNIMGFRENKEINNESFIMAPALPKEWMVCGRYYQMSNLLYKGNYFSIKYEVLDDSNLKMTIEPRILGHKVIIEGVDCLEDDGVWTANVINMNVYSAKVK